MIPTPHPAAAADLPEALRLADDYAESRHINGTHLYNKKTADARNALAAALAASAPAEAVDKESLTAAQPQAGAESYEHQHAVMEAQRNAKAEEYFKARHEMLDTIAHRRIFEAGFDRGWDSRATAALRARGAVPTNQQLCEMAYLLQITPRGEQVPLQLLQVLRRQFVAALTVAAPQAPASPASEQAGGEQSVDLVSLQRRAFIRGWDRRGMAHGLNGGVETDQRMRELMNVFYPRTTPISEQAVVEALRRFIDAAAGEGLVLNGIDAADLFQQTFPAEYARAITTPAHGGEAPAEGDAAFENWVESQDVDRLSDGYNAWLENSRNCWDAALAAKSQKGGAA